MTYITYVVAFLITVGTLVAFHEFGHFLMARACGVKVLRFCVGFGKIIGSRRFTSGATEWAIAAIPLGGYVKMLDEREGPVDPRERDQAFNRQSLGKRFLIVLAGPLANLLLAIGVYWLVYMQGLTDIRPVLKEPTAGSIAQQAGIKAGMEVVALGGEPVIGVRNMQWQLVQGVAHGKPVSIELKSADNQRWHFILPLDRVALNVIEGDVLGSLGFELSLPLISAVLGKVRSGSPAQSAGLQAGDRVLRVGNESVADFQDFARHVRSSPGRQLQLEVDRNGQRLTIQATPGIKAGVGFLGITARPLDEASRARMLVVVHQSLPQALYRAVQKTWQTAFFTLRMIGSMIVGDLSWKNVSGFITIADYAGQSAQLGLVPYLKFIALISISLGILNLLPIPLLDGGHLLFYCIEWIKGSPLSEQVMEIGQRLGMGVLMMLLCLALYNDLIRLIG